MTEWRQLAERFQLFNFMDFSLEEANEYTWDTLRVGRLIEDTCNRAREFLPFDNITVTVFPAVPFPWHKNLPRPIWTNGFTNGPNNIQIAIPPLPDEDFLCYMIAHELHHATVKNPIYKLTTDTFTLAEWFKMEGGAEYFSLSLYPDKRWWKNDFSPETERMYWNRVKYNCDSADGKTKNLYAFGDPKKGIPFMAGYAFAYKLFLSYTESYQGKSYVDLLTVKPAEFLDIYQK
jgi:hypothetical protein